MGRIPIGVFPPEFLHQRRRLFSSLSSVVGAEFVSRLPGQIEGLVGAVVSGSRQTAGDLVAAGIPSLLIPDNGEPAAGRSAVVRLHAVPELDSRLHDQGILEAGAASVAPLPAGQGSIVATGPNGPVWRASEASGVTLHEVASAPDELLEGERLKDRLRAGRFLSLVPIVHFVRDLSPQWERPPVRASIVFDDANLHSRSYGYLRYRAIAEHAARHAYHVNVATIPLDCWFANPRTVELFTAGAPLSLLVHGNNHTKRELGHKVTEDEALRIAAAVRQRVETFERKVGLAVSRVMSPPHGSVSDTMMSALRRTGFDAVAYWGPTDDSPPALVGWQPADVHLGGGLPGLHRVPVDAPLDELVLRAFLDQPLLLSGHHIDLASGLDVLADAASRVNRIGDVVWSSIAEAAGCNFRLRRKGDVLHLQPYARHLRLDVPEGVSALVVDWRGRPEDRGEWVVRPLGGAGPSVASGAPAEGIPLSGAATVELIHVDADTVDRATIGAARWRPWPVVRRCLTEGRDRVQPVLRPARVPS